MLIDTFTLEKELNKRGLDEFKIFEEEDLSKLTLEREFEDFHTAMEFVNDLADLAETTDHHPDVCIHFNKVSVELWTHSENGVTELDLDFAEKINQLS